MTRTRNHRRSLRGFTLIELLVVISIIAVLAGILLPAVIAVTRAAKEAATKSLIGRIELALAAIHKDTSIYPPDYLTDPIPFRRVAAKFPGYKVPTGNGLPPEALAWALSNPNIANEPDIANYVPNICAHVPYLQLARGKELQDCNDNGLPEVVDAWGRPLLYNRIAFPSGHQLQACDFSQHASVLANPAHRGDTYDLFSVGADGQTGANDLPEPGKTTLTQFCTKALDNTNDGNGSDDITIWKR